MEISLRITETLSSFTIIPLLKRWRLYHRPIPRLSKLIFITPFSCERWFEGIRCKQLQTAALCCSDQSLIYVYTEIDRVYGMSQTFPLPSHYREPYFVLIVSHHMKAKWMRLALPWSCFVKRSKPLGDEGFAHFLFYGCFTREWNICYVLRQTLDISLHQMAVMFFKVASISHKASATLKGFSATISIFYRCVNLPLLMVICGFYVPIAYPF